MKLKKYSGNPILSPDVTSSWESLAVCNPAAWYENGRFYLLYRAMGNEPGNKIYVGLATSDDGFNFTRASEMPVLAPGDNNFDGGAVEDPRIVKFGDEYYVTYAFRAYPPGEYWKLAYDEVIAPEHSEYTPLCLKKNIGNSALAISKDLRVFRKVGRLTESYLDDRDVILFPEKIGGKYYMLHRPKEYVGDNYGTLHSAIWIKSSDDLMSWHVPSKLLIKGEQDWELKVGGSAPPIKTDEGWLMLYHGVDANHCYRVGAVILDLDDPTKILYRTKDYIMEPEADFERNGLYRWGVVFPTGNVVVDGTLYVYYGASDQWCCVATADLRELIDFIKNNT